MACDQTDAACDPRRGDRQSELFDLVAARAGAPQDALIHLKREAIVVLDQIPWSRPTKPRDTPAWQQVPARRSDRLAGRYVICPDLIDTLHGSYNGDEVGTDDMPLIIRACCVCGYCIADKSDLTLHHEHVAARTLAPCRQGLGRLMGLMVEFVEKSVLANDSIEKSVLANDPIERYFASQTGDGWKSYFRQPAGKDLC